MEKVLLATNNHAKVERFKNLISKTEISVELVTPEEVGVTEIDVVEDGKTLTENAEKKARAYFGQVNLPILGNDTGFWIETEGFVDAPKRVSLGEYEAHELSNEEIAERMLNFWKQKASDNGGRVDAAWMEVFVLIHPDGSIDTTESRREVILTDTVYGEAHLQMPVRALYISKATNKPAIQHTEEEELLEMQPVISALKELLK